MQQVRVATRRDGLEGLAGVEHYVKHDVLSELHEEEINGQICMFAGA
jgi:hypothetical protein